MNFEVRVNRELDVGEEFGIVNPLGRYNAYRETKCWLNAEDRDVTLGDLVRTSLCRFLKSVLGFRQFSRARTSSGFGRIDPGQQGPESEADVRPPTTETATPNPFKVVPVQAGRIEAVWQKRPSSA
ncbi:MAG: hypothetical protein L0387_24745 [Acidobacteria bacterium]|nr:hypothetical protein [Acidobacteriota bacterium]MCI0719097.1 hypothetical protein [Acidobacteriota bacterium]